MKNISMLILAAVFAACTMDGGENDFVTESGVEVSCIVKGDGSALMSDSVAILYIKMVTQDESAQVLMETTPEQPMPLAYDPMMEAGHIQEVLRDLEVGDSVVFETTIQNLFEETYKTGVPPDMNPETSVQVSMKLADQMSKTAFTAYSMELQQRAQEKEMAMAEEKIGTDGLLIDSYLDSLGIDATTTDSGLRYIITEPADGATAEPGDAVTVHYDGRLITGEPFDSSRDRGEPFTFTIGQGSVIPGWDEGIAYIPEGGKATLYIPSPLAYGSRSPSASIPAYSILVFDVEVLNVEPQ